MSILFSLVCVPFQHMVHPGYGLYHGPRFYPLKGAVDMVIGNRFPPRLDGDRLRWKDGELGLVLLLELHKPGMEILHESVSVVRVSRQ
jgi:hypothetical protein